MSNMYYTEIPEQQLTVKTTAYSSGQVVGGLLVFPLANRPASGIITRAHLVDDANQKAALTLYLFDATPTVFADGEAFAPSVSDLQKLLDGAPISLAASSYQTINGNAVLAWPGTTGEDFRSFHADSGTLYAYLVAGGAVTYAAATDLWLRLTAMFDV